MKKLFVLCSFIAISAHAEEYKAPKLQALDWQKQKSAVIKNQEWTSDYSIKTLGQEDQNLKNPQRKPSSGEELARPKFWDFKKVK